MVKHKNLNQKVYIHIMTRKEILENLKLQFKKLMFDSASTQLITTDGKNIIVMGSDAEVGLEIYLLNPDNTQTALDNGDYILDDGRTISVTDGKISDVKAPDASATSNDSPDNSAMAGATASDATTPETETDDSAIDEEIVTRIEALEEAVNQILDMLQGAMSKTEQTMSGQKELKEKFEKFAAAPSTDKIEVKPKLKSGKNQKDIFFEEILELKNKKRKL